MTCLKENKTKVAKCKKKRKSREKGTSVTLKDDVKMYKEETTKTLRMYKEQKTKNCLKENGRKVARYRKKRKPR